MTLLLLLDIDDSLIEKILSTLYYIYLYHLYLDLVSPASNYVCIIVQNAY